MLSAQRGEGAYALLYIDLDQFKVVNDTCGHQAGDRLLRDVTGLLQGRVRASDTIARLGGDEFGVLLEGCTPEQSARVADGVRQAIKDYRFVWGASTLSVGASVGVVQITAETESVAAIMSAADIACYAAKDEGRNRVHVYDADGVSHRHREMHWVARVTGRRRKTGSSCSSSRSYGSARRTHRLFMSSPSGCAMTTGDWFRPANSFQRRSVTTSCRSSTGGS